MKLRIAAAALVLVSLAAGSFSDRSPRPKPARFAGGYQMLTADFHVHSFPLSWSTLSPFDTVLEARRQGLDAIAMTGHNHVWVSLLGAWFSRVIGGPIIVTGEEIHAPAYHLIALGIRRTVDWRLPAAAASAEIHRQGGVAIAAHPTGEYWAGFDDAAMRLLDGAEVDHPVTFGNPRARAEIRQFYARRRLTAIGSSDFHAMGSIGAARTYVFVRENSERGILEALRQGRTVVMARDGAVFGDPELIRLGVVPPLESPRRNVWNRVSLVAGALGLLAGIAVMRRR
jgi:PHP-associated